MTEVIHSHKIGAALPAFLDKAKEEISSPATKKVAACDSITTASKNTIETASPSTPGSIELPAPNNSNGYLMTLTEAYAKVYATMSSTVVDQINEQNSLQTLDQTMSVIMTQSTLTTIQQQGSLYAKAQAENEQELKDEQNAQEWAKWMQVVGVVLLIVTIGVSIATAGATSEMLPEEMEMMEMTTTESTATTTSLSTTSVTPEMSEMDSMDEMGSSTENSIQEENPSLNSESEEEDEPIDQNERMQNLMKQTNEMMNPEDETEESLGKETEQDLSKSDEEFNKTTSKWKNVMARLSRGLMGTATGVLNALPYYFNGQAELYQSKCQSDIANLTRALGPQVGNMQETTIYFQFYQQLCQRGAQFVQQLAQETSSAVEIDGTCMSAYRQIAVSLAQAA